MIKLDKRWAWAMAFVLVLAASGWAGVRWGQHVAGPDLMCDAQSVYAQGGAKQAELVFARLSLDLNTDRLSYLRMAVERVDTDHGRITDAMQRYSTFMIKREGERLLVEVQDAGKGQADAHLPYEYPRLGLFILQPASRLSYRIRELDGSHYLIDGGAEMFILCNQHRDTAVNHDADIRTVTQ